MRFVVITPTTIALDQPDVRHVRAEDHTGAFGIQPGHADFLTALTVCVVRWRDASSAEHYLAARGGVLRVGANLVEIATREAVVSDDLDHLRNEVLAAMSANAEAEHAARAGALRLEHAAIREIYHYLRPLEQPLRAPRRSR